MASLSSLSSYIIYFSTYINQTCSPVYPLRQLGNFRFGRSKPNICELLIFQMWTTRSLMLHTVIALRHTKLGCSSSFYLPSHISLTDIPYAYAKQNRKFSCENRFSPVLFQCLSPHWHYSPHALSMTKLLVFHQLPMLIRRHVNSFPERIC